MANRKLLCRHAVFCAHIAASLPFVHTDEPLLLLYHINQLIARHGDEARVALKKSLEGGVSSQRLSQVAASPQPENTAGDTQDHEASQACPHSTLKFDRRADESSWLETALLYQNFKQ